MVCLRREGFVQILYLLSHEGNDPEFVVYAGGSLNGLSSYKILFILVS